MTNIEQDMPGVTFYAEDALTERKLLALSIALAEDGIISQFGADTYRENPCKSLKVWAHGNAVAPYLPIMKYVH
jgi:hypothetical protein